MRREPPRRTLGVALAAAIALAVLAGLLITGGPGTARLERLDERRAADLDALAGWIERYHDREGRLPASLGELEPSLPGSVSALDPETGAHYRYEVLEGDHFRLCATLALPDKTVAERPHARRLDTRRALEPEPDPTGRTLCLRSVDLPPPSD